MELFVLSEGEDLRSWSTPLPGRTSKAFFLDEVLDGVPEGVMRLVLHAESRRPIGLSPRGQPCGDGPYGRDPVDE